MARPSGEKTRCGGMWTEARYNSFIKSLLRSGSKRWAPIQQVKKDARVSRGLYECAECGEHVPPTVKEGSKRVKNIAVDHIKPVVDPEKGFESWDIVIENMFCEQDNLQLICKDCHDEKQKEETAVRTESRRQRKLNEQ